MINVVNEFDNESTNIIDSEEKFIIVDSCPGSGKTYIIVEKALKKINFFIEQNKGVIVCSFTRNTSDEIKNRLKNRLIHNENLNYSFIGTLDSFIINEISKPFFKRILMFIKKTDELLDNKEFTIIYGSDEGSEILEFLGHTDKKIQTFKDLWDNLPPLLSARLKKVGEVWLNNSLRGKYEISFFHYIFATIGLKNLNIVKKYISSRYSSIFIDEAQDLNVFQILFLNELKRIGLNIFLFGDSNQNLYSWRGSNPNLFLNYEKEGFRKFELTNSKRVPEDIFFFANNILKNKKEQYKKNSQNIIIYSNIDDLYKFGNFSNINYLILVEKRNHAKEIYEKLTIQKNINLVYEESLNKTNNNELKKFMKENDFSFIENLLFYFYNFNNKNPKNTYSIDDIFLYIQSKYPNVDEKNMKIFLKNLKNKKISQFLQDIFSILKKECNNLIFQIIEEELKDEIYMNHYLLNNNLNKITTIHGAKGLESDEIFIVLSSDSIIDKEKQRLLYVALTRAKKRVYIFNYCRYKKIKSFEYISDIYNGCFLKK